MIAYEDVASWDCELYGISKQVPALVISTQDFNEKHGKYNWDRIAKAYYPNSWDAALEGIGQSGNEGYQKNSDSILQIGKITTKIKNGLFTKNVEKKILLDEIVHEFISKEFTIIDNDVNAKSLISALKFLIKMPSKYVVPTYGVHPDKEFSLIWSDSNRNILSLAFSDTAMIHYSYYSPINNTKSKGQLSFKKMTFDSSTADVPETAIIKALIASFMPA